MGSQLSVGQWLPFCIRGKEVTAVATKAVEAVLKKENFVDAMIADARKNADAVIEQSKKTAEDRRNAVLAEAKMKADSILSNANAESEKIRKKAEEEAQKQRELLLSTKDGFIKNSTEAVKDAVI